MSPWEFVLNLFKKKSSIPTVISNNSQSSLNFVRSVRFTLRHEGGSEVTENPKDPGGLTKWGIALKYHPELTREKLLSLTQEEAETIYYRQYWVPAGCDSMKWPLCQVLFDSAVNPGLGAALEFFSKALGETDEQKARSIISQRVLYYQAKVKQKPSRKIFLRGWMSRIADLKKECGLN